MRGVWAIYIAVLIAVFIAPTGQPYARSFPFASPELCEAARASHLEALPPVEILAMTGPHEMTRFAVCVPVKASGKDA